MRMKLKHVLKHTEMYDFKDKEKMYMNAIHVINAKLSCAKKVVKRIVKTLSIISQSCVSMADAPPSSVRSIACQKIT